MLQTCLLPFPILLHYLLHLWPPSNFSPSALALLVSADASGLFLCCECDGQIAALRLAVLSDVECGWQGSLRLRKLLESLFPGILTSDE